MVEGVTPVAKTKVRQDAAEENKMNGESAAEGADLLLLLRVQTKHYAPILLRVQTKHYKCRQV